MLRRRYGAHFASGCAENEKLIYVLHKPDEHSLSKLLRDHEAGKLGKISGEEASP
jgi:hypothetical protein